MYIYATPRVGIGLQGDHERFVVINFMVKVVFIVLWVSLILLWTELPRISFVVSLLVNFFIWHVFEAYQYQGYLSGDALTR